jgi:hypothetical protein
VSGVAVSGAPVLITTRDEAARAVTARIAERDRIQANLADLDSSLGRRLLAGAALTGTTRARWEQFTADMAALLEVLAGYSGVIDKAADLVGRAGGRTRAGVDLAQAILLLTGPSVELADALPPLDRRGLTSAGHRQLTLDDAVTEMNGAFARAAEVVTAAEAVWNHTAERLRQVAVGLSAARRDIDGVSDAALAGRLVHLEAGLAALRATVNGDPLSLWQPDRVDTAQLDGLEQQASVAAAAARELARLAGGADHRIAEVAGLVAAARAAEQDASAARATAAAKIRVTWPPILGPAPDLAGRLEGARALATQGRWPQLAAELAAVEQAAAAAIREHREAEREAVALTGRRSELKGRIKGYRAKAAAHGGAEDPGLEESFERARDLLREAPCDLDAAADAVDGYVQAVLAFARRETQR